MHWFLLPRLFVCIPPLHSNHELCLLVPARESHRFTVLKVLGIKGGEREGMLVVLGAIKAAHARARERVKVGGGDAGKYQNI